HTTFLLHFEVRNVGYKDNSTIPKTRGFGECHDIRVELYGTWVEYNDGAGECNSRSREWEKRSLTVN
ncbi:MAG: hypothetical protein F6K35_44145, partial [Okeania sp. SIO2H7]|nr:hypothetical protein [Okeania sp. SIO2H7]